MTRPGTPTFGIRSASEYGQEDFPVNDSYYRPSEEEKQTQASSSTRHHTKLSSSSPIIAGIEVTFDDKRPVRKRANKQNLGSHPLDPTSENCSSVTSKAREPLAPANVQVEAPESTSLLPQRTSIGAPLPRHDLKRTPSYITAPTARLPVERAESNLTTSSLSCSGAGTVVGGLENLSSSTDVTKMPTARILHGIAPDSGLAPVGSSPKLLAQRRSDDENRHQTDKTCCDSSEESQVIPPGNKCVTNSSSDDNPQAGADRTDPDTTALSQSQLSPSIADDETQCPSPEDARLMPSPEPLQSLDPLTSSLGEPTDTISNRDDSSSDNPRSKPTNFMARLFQGWVGTAFDKLMESHGPVKSPSAIPDRSIVHTEVSIPRLYPCKANPPVSVSSFDGVLSIDTGPDGEILAWPCYLRRIMYPPERVCAPRYPWYPRTAYDAFPWCSINDIYFDGTPCRRMFYGSRITLSSREVRAFAELSAHACILRAEHNGVLLGLHKILPKAEWLDDVVADDLAVRSRPGAKSLLTQIEDFMDELLDLKSQQNPAQRGGDAWAPRPALRYLQLEMYDPKNTLARCVKAALWISRVAPFIYDGDILRPFLANGAIKLEGLDIKLRPVIIITVEGLYAWQMQGVKDLPKLTSFVMGFWVAFFIQHLLIPGKVEQLVILIDDTKEQSTAFKAMTMSVVKELNRSIFTHLPGYIGNVIVLYHPMNTMSEKSMWLSLATCGISYGENDGDQSATITQKFVSIVTDEQSRGSLAETLQAYIPKESLSLKYGGLLPYAEHVYPPQPLYHERSEDANLEATLHNLGGVNIHGRAIQCRSEPSGRPYILPTDHRNLTKYVLLGGVLTPGSRSGPAVTPKYAAPMERVGERIQITYDHCSSKQPMPGNVSPQALITSTPSTVKLLRRFLWSLQKTHGEIHGALVVCEQLAQSMLVCYPRPVESVPVSVWQSNAMYWYGRDKKKNPCLVVRAEAMGKMPSSLFCAGFQALMDWGMRYLTVEGSYDRFNLVINVNAWTNKDIPATIGEGLEGLGRRYPAQLARVFVLGQVSRSLRESVGRSVLNWLKLEFKEADEPYVQDRVVDADFGSDSAVKKYIPISQMDPTLLPLKDVKPGATWPWASSTPKAYFPR